jgi:hypothetical protein
LNYSTKFGDFILIFVNSEYLGILKTFFYFFQERGSQEPQYSEAWKFINSFEKMNETVPRILFSHIPLHRNGESECGKEYRTRPLSQGHGYDYQNLLSEMTSNMLVEKLKPNRIFSGDDHEPCEHLHKSSGIVENTVGTFSWLQGNIRPSFGLLNLIKFKENEKIQYKVEFESCRTPNQTFIYIWYGICTFISLFILFPVSFKYRYEHFKLWRKKFDDLEEQREEEEDCFHIFFTSCFYLFKPQLISIAIIFTLLFFCLILWEF